MKIIVDSQTLEQALQKYFEKRYKLSVRLVEATEDITVEETTGSSLKASEKPKDELLERLKKEAKELGVLPRGRVSVEKLQKLIDAAKQTPVIDQDTLEDEDIPFEETNEENTSEEEETHEEETPRKKFLKR